MEKARGRMAEYLKALDAADAQESAGPELVKGLKEKIERWQAREAQARERLATLKETQASQLSATDPDSRGMKGSQGHVVGYNVQGAVDAKHHLLAVLEATNQPVDQGQLATVAQAAKAELQIGQADLLADGGYFKNQDIKSCQEMGMEPHVPEAAPPGDLYGKRIISCARRFFLPATRTIVRRERS